MKAWLLKEPGSIDNLIFEEIKEMSTGQDQLKVKVFSASLIPVDYKLIKAGHSNWNYPHVTGFDLAGEVIEIGQGAVGFQLGDRACHT